MKKQVNAAVIVLGMLFGCAYADIVPALVSDTGPNTASTQADIQWPLNRFVTESGNKGDCVVDTMTGLIWVRDLNSVPIINANPGNATDWVTAKESIAALNQNGGLCGFTDWRLPNLTELKSLLNYADAFGPVDYLNSAAAGFANVQSTTYWSATQDNAVTNSGWGIYMGIGYVYHPPGNAYVWPVRGGA